MSVNYVQTNTFYLAGSGVVIGATSIVLTSLTDIYSNVLTMTSFGSKGYGTLEPDTTNEEAFTFTGITANANGTYTLTGVSTALAQSPYTETSGLVRGHVGGTKMVITDSAVFWSRFTNKDNAEVLSQNWQAPDPIAMQDIATKAYVLSVVSGGTVSVDKLIPAAIADATVAAGNVLYLKTNGRWAKADASATASSVGVLLGIAQGSGTSGNAITGGVLIDGLDANQSGIAAGSSYYLTNTPGTISTTPGTYSVQVGVGSTISTRLFFSPAVGALNKALVSTTSVANGVPQAASTGFISNGWLGNLFTSDTDQTQGTSNATVTVGEANATTKHAKLAQKFIPTIPSIKGVRLWKIADTGSFTGTITVSLQADSAGSPSGSDLATTTITNAAWLKLTAAAEFGVAFSSEYASLAVGSAYWIVITTSTNDNSNHPNVGANSAGGYAAGLLRYFNGTDNWVTINTTMLYFKTLEGVQSKIEQTNTEGLVPVAIRPSSIIAIGTTLVNVATTVTETTVYSKLIEGGFFTANVGLRALIRGLVTGNNGSGADIATTIKVKYNGNTIITILTPTALNTGNGVGAWAFNTELVFLNNGSVSSQIVWGTMNPYPVAQAGTAVVTSAYLTPAISSAATAAVDVSGPGLLEITFTNSVNVASSTFTQAILEKIAA